MALIRVNGNVRTTFLIDESLILLVNMIEVLINIDGFIRQSFQMRLSAKLSDAFPLFVSNSFSTFQALFSSSCKSRDPYYFLLVESTFPGRLLELETEQKLGGCVESGFGESVRGESTESSQLPPPAKSLSWPTRNSGFKILVYQKITHPIAKVETLLSKKNCVVFFVSNIPCS